VTNNAIDSMDTSHHSTETKQNLQDKLEPTAENLGEQLLNFINSNKENPTYSVSIFEYKAENGKLLTDTTISRFVSNETLKSSEEYTVTSDKTDKVMGVSGSSEFSLNEASSTSSIQRFSISSPKINKLNEWRASMTTDDGIYHTGDQGLVGAHVGLFGDRRSDIERGQDISRAATDMVGSFTGAA